MQALFFGMWDTPISGYLIFYLVIALAGFLAGYWKRGLIVGPILAVIWFGARDFQEFYRWQINPPVWYVFSVAICMIFAVVASVIGAILRTLRLRQASLR